MYCYLTLSKTIASIALRLQRIRMEITIYICHSNCPSHVRRGTCLLLEVRSSDEVPRLTLATSRTAFYNCFDLVPSCIRVRFYRSIPECCPATVSLVNSFRRSTPRPSHLCTRTPYLISTHDRNTVASVAPLLHAQDHDPGPVLEK